MAKKREKEEAEVGQHLITPPVKIQYVVIGDGQFVDNKALPSGTLVTVSEAMDKSFAASGLQVVKVTGEWTPPEPPSSEE